MRRSENDFHGKVTTNANLTKDLGCAKEEGLKFSYLFIKDGQVGRPPCTSASMRTLPGNPVPYRQGNPSLSV